MFKFTRLLLNKSGKTNGLPVTFRFNNYSSTTVTKTKIVKENDIKIPIDKTNNLNYKSDNSIVAAAFASLQSDTEIKTPFTDQKILKATTIDELLSISFGAGVSRNHALKVVSILADWSAKGKIKLSDFETDPRFLRLCRILTRSPNTYKNTVPRSLYSSRSEDLSTILSVTADDEAAKLVESITLPQMVKVTSMLASKKRRSMLLLRTLAYNITRNSEKLDLKQSSDLLYSMACLNFIDENLLERIYLDILTCLDVNKDRSSVVGSILTSLGLLKYRELGLLDALSDWVLKNYKICRTQDIFALFLTLAVLNYHPLNAEELYKVIIPDLKMSDASKPAVWLDLIWSLVLLQQANTNHISSVLSEKFLCDFEEKTFSTSSKLKLLNIDAAASLIPEYNGPRISEESVIKNVEIVRTRDKDEMIQSLIDTLKNLIQNESYMKVKVNTGMGFCIDVECLLDKKCNPVPFNSENSSQHTKLAIMAQDYHDLCKGCVELTGMNVFNMRLLEAKGYKILPVLYTEFKPKDKLVNRVQYIEKKLKSTSLL